MITFSIKYKEDGLHEKPVFFLVGLF